VDVAAAGDMNLPYTDNKYTISIERSPFHRSNLTAYKQLKTIIDQNNYAIIHCHTPLGGVLARLAARQARKQGTKVIYTAHGFHFCSGSSLINWLIYYPIEKYLSRHTDTLITINQEDYQLANSHKFMAGSIEQIHGVGVDAERFKPVGEKQKMELKKSFGYQADDFLLFYAAEFNKNKNQQFLLHVMKLLKDDDSNVKLLLAGEGALLESSRQLADMLGISHMIDFLGFRKDLQEIMPICDLAVASSLREGLPVNVMEAMACGLPVVAVDNRGHRELVRNAETGWVLPIGDLLGFSEKVKDLVNRPDVKKEMGQNGRDAILATYSTNKVLLEKGRIYKSCMKEREDTMWVVQ
jgi:glycosyltransferase EpsD